MVLLKPLSSGAGGIAETALQLVLRNLWGLWVSEWEHDIHTVYYRKPPAGSGAAPKSNMLIFLQQDLPKESHKWDKLKAVKSL